MLKNIQESIAIPEKWLIDVARSLKERICDKYEAGLFVNTILKKNDESFGLRAPTLDVITAASKHTFVSKDTRDMAAQVSELEEGSL